MSGQKKEARLLSPPLDPDDNNNNNNNEERKRNNISITAWNCSSQLYPENPKSRCSLKNSVNLSQTTQK